MWDTFFIAKIIINLRILAIHHTISDVSCLQLYEIQRLKLIFNRIKDIAGVLSQKLMLLR